MTRHVIRFGKLAEFVVEPFVPDQVVRVVVLEISEGVSAPIPDLRQVNVGVHIRTINSEGTILACDLPWLASSYTTAVAQAIPPGKNMMPSGRRLRRLRSASSHSYKQRRPRKGSPCGRRA